MEDQLRNVDWNNILIVGDAIVASIMVKAVDLNEIRKYFNTEYGESTIDICIYGLNQNDAEIKIKEIHELLIRNVPFDIKIEKTNFSIIFSTIKPFKNIQIYY